MDTRLQRRQSIVDLIHEQGNDSFGEGASEEVIARCEQQLGTTFPDSYRWFLREFGFAYWPREICGVSQDSALDVVRNTEGERHEVEPELPAHLVAFCPDGWGNNYCLDTSRLVEGECPVVFWNHERGQDQLPDLTHAMFVDWRENMIRPRRDETEAG
jgi:hypothetical protein